MPYLADMQKANAYVKAKQLVGNGQCVTFVHAVVTTPPASLWRRGDAVRDNKNMLPGTIIATFDSDGHYGNRTDGTSHAAVYLFQTSGGIMVLDQWNGRTKQPPHQRLIRFKDGKGLTIDDGSQYYVVQ